MAYYEDIVELLNGDGKVKCILCEEYLLDDNSSITSHLNGDPHMQLYIKRIMVRNSINIQERRVYCFLCKSDVHELESHVQSNEHQQNMESIKLVIKKDGEFMELPSNGTKNRSHCIICAHDIDFTMEKITEHIQSIKHRRARAIAVQPFNGIFSVDGTDDLWCKICQICFENYIEIIFQHVDEDTKHVTTLSKIQRLITGQDITIDQYLTDPTEDKAKCHKCNIEVPCNQDNIERHVKGKRHKNA